MRFCSSVAMRLLKAASKILSAPGAWPQASRIVVVLPVPARARTTRFPRPVAKKLKIAFC